MAELLEELLARCRSGEADAARRLVERYRDWALDLAERMVHDRHLAEDVVQEAFVEALLHLGSLREDAAFPGWLRQIVRTRVGRTNRGRREAVGEVSGRAGGGDDDPLARAEAKEVRALVREAVARLPAAGRREVELFYLRQWTVGDVARELGVPEGTVKRRLHAARGKLREILSEQGLQG